MFWETATLAAGGAAVPFSKVQTYVKGTIRPSHYSQAEQDADVEAYYQLWKGDYLVREKSELAEYRVAMGKSGKARARTVSEGQGYGMLIVPLMAGHDEEAQEIFDGLWRFARAHPSGIESRLMAWEFPEKGRDSADSAFDGDADMAYGLLLADRQWGSAGAVNYRQAALEVIAGIKAATIGKKSRLPLLGDWVDGEKYNEWQTRTSDFLFGHFRAFGRATGDPVWEEVITATQSVMAQLQTRYSRETGLLPDFVVAESTEPYLPKPAPPKFLEAKTDGAYGYNACRVPWRIGTDALLNGASESFAAVRKISGWIERATASDPLKVKAGYELGGQPLPNSDYVTNAFIAPLGVAAMTDPAQQKWLDAIYEAVRKRRADYYEDSLTMLSLLVMTGHFWDPTLPDLGDR